MKGKIALDNPPAYLEISYNPRTQQKFVAYPPMPAVMIMPFVALNFADKNQTYYTILFASVTIGLAFIVFKRLFSQRTSLLLTFLYGFGTSFWYLTTEGSSWYISHVIAAFFIFLSLIALNIRKHEDEIQYEKNPTRWLLSGLALGAAFMTRDPSILASTFFISLPFLHLKFRELISHKAVHILKNHARPFVSFGIALSLFISVTFAYNYARFGTIKPVQHDHIPHLLEGEMFKHGFLSVQYIPRSINFFFTKMPLPYEKFPYFMPSIEGMAFWLVSPYLVFILFAQWKKPFTRVAFITALIMLIPPFMNGSNGFAQFGYRYAMEATIFLMLVFGTFLERKWWWVSIPLMLAAPLISFWGIYFIRVLGISGW